MRLKNSTDFPDHYLRKMTSWCCRKLGLPVRYVQSAEFRNRHTTIYSGHAYLYQHRIVCSVAASGDHAGRADILVGLTAHELSHLEHFRRGDRTRGHGKGVGGSEKSVEWHAARVLDAYRAKRAELEAKWLRPRATRERPSLSPVERRAAKAVRDLEKWQRRLKIAQTKLKKAKARMAYYAKRAATTGGAP